MVLRPSSRSSSRTAAHVLVGLHRLQPAFEHASSPIEQKARRNTCPQCHVRHGWSKRSAVLPDQPTTPNKLGHYGLSAGRRECAERDAGEIDLSPRKYNSRLSNLSIKLSKYSMTFNTVTN
jgi:hypothetical protein